MRTPCFMLLLSLCLISPASARSSLPVVWWRTAGAEVIEDADPISGELVCSLYSYDQDRAAIISWRQDEPPWLSVSNPAWQFGETGRDLTIAVQIGDNWLGQNPTPGRRAHGYKSVITVPVQNPIENLLPDATQIRVVPGGREAEAAVSLNARKMPALLRAVERCRAVLRANR